MKTHQEKMGGHPKSRRQKNKENTKESARWFIIAPPPFTDGKWHLATTLEGSSYKSIVANNKYTVVLTAGSRHAVLFAAATHGVREIDVFGMFGTEEVSKARACCNSSAKELLAITETKPEDTQHSFNHWPIRHKECGKSSTWTIQARSLLQNLWLEGKRWQKQPLRGSISIPYPSELNSDEIHKAAADALVAKFCKQDLKEYGTPENENPWNRPRVMCGLPNNKGTAHVYIPR